jgi:hypothetical protein
MTSRELISFKVAVNETAETYGLTHSSAVLDVINLIKDHNKKAHVLFLSALSKWDIDFVFHIWNPYYDIPLERVFDTGNVKNTWVACLVRLQKCGLYISV